MTSIPVSCATCSGTGWATHEDRHTETNRDICLICGGTGQVQARPGESRETSWPWAVPGAQPDSAVAGGDVPVEPAHSDNVAEIIRDMFDNAAEENGYLTDAGDDFSYLRDQVIEYVRMAMAAGRISDTPVTPPPAGEVNGLEALSRAATQGEWSTGGVFDSYGSRPTMFIWGPRAGDAQSGQLLARSLSIPDARLATALVNAYRSGRLVERTPTAGIQAAREGEHQEGRDPDGSDHSAEPEPASGLGPSGECSSRITLEGIEHLLWELSRDRDTEPEDVKIFGHAWSRLREYRSEARRIIFATHGHWSAWSEEELDSDPSDPLVGRTIEWFVGLWRTGEPEADTCVRTGSGRSAERIARELAADLNEMVSLTGRARDQRASREDGDSQPRPEAAL